MMIKLYSLFFISILLRSLKCETTETTETETLLKTYKNYINASHDLDKSDRNIMKTWTADFQIQLVNITTHYRLEMTRHKEHSFMSIKTNSKWNECVNFHRSEIDAAEKSYYIDESKCLKVANAEEVKKRHAVYQMEKEIRKWRKSYKYLLKQCNSNNPGDENAAGICLVEYMQKDNYHITFQRLILLKLESMSDLYSQILASLQDCETCLKKTLFNYINEVRTIMDNLNRCYKRKI
ncbi:uncharacterized protein LOC113401483 [Vanessa tameamea]|uniref:Uncharacterized protein LOC113401483 n=1 Tax=Vanessa tameamea TaxID=334116 RepID=A0A8B8ILB1_VANTA